MNTVFFKNLGTIDFKKAWGVQESILNSIVFDKRCKKPTKSYLLFCQHPHVYTLGKSGKKENLLLNDEELHLKNADFYKINRGGDITYHGPGQLVVYPVLDLDNFFTDIHKYLRFLENVVFNVLKEYNLTGVRLDGSTGVWLNSGGDFKKICAMGVRASRWVTMHGLAFNVMVDLDYFKNIIPCGITDKGVTSLNLEVGCDVSFSKVEDLFRVSFEKVFNCRLVDL
jgi:lipoyl(octanoyl) transferase